MEKLNNILINKCFLETAPEPSSTLKDDLGIDSLGIVELITFIEDEYGFQFEISDLNPENLITVNDLCLLVEKYVA